MHASIMHRNTDFRKYSSSNPLLNNILIWLQRPLTPLKFIDAVQFFSHNFRPSVSLASVCYCVWQVVEILFQKLQLTNSKEGNTVPQLKIQPQANGPVHEMKFKSMKGATNETVLVLPKRKVGRIIIALQSMHKL